MNIYVLMAQRKCKFPGEYAPETLVCMSEAEYDDNPECLYNSRKIHLSSNDFEAVEIITLKVNSEDINRRLFPTQEPISVECR